MSSKKNYGSFPDPLASFVEKAAKSYGLKYARAIVGQWGSSNESNSLYGRRMKEFNTNRDYANGTQDTSKYKQVLNSLDPNNGDGTLLNIDWSPVPIIPKFVKIVVNKILSREPYPNLEAVDPLSLTEKERKKAEVQAGVENREFFNKMKEAGLNPGIDVDKIPDTAEEAEIFLDTNIKVSSEIAAQIATNLTLQWNDFPEKIYRRAVEDLVAVGMAVVKRDNDPNYGISTKYVDPEYFVHSQTEDATMSDLNYAGHISRMSIEELKRISRGEFEEEQYEEMARQVKSRYSNDPTRLGNSNYDESMNKTVFGYDNYIIEVLDFEFMSSDCLHFEEKESRFGNVGFYYKGQEEINIPSGTVFERKAHKMEHATVYGGKFIVGTKYMFDYGLKKNLPRNIHDITRTRMSYSVISTNLRKMMPKSMVSSIKQYADMMQLAHLKLQQSVAKAKPDGLIIDVEGLENVQLGKGGDLQPLEIQDIYEQTGVFYYRSKNPEGGFQNPPIREIGNAIRNIQELIGIYNQYLNMIRDTTGLNEVVDGSTPKGDSLVGVRQQAISASNNAIYDITHASQVLYKRVCEDIVKCLQVLSPDSILYRVYEKAVGETNMAILSSFKDLPMFNFGVRVVTNMNDEDRMYLEQNIAQSIAQGELDIEDALAIRRLKDVDQAERLLVVRRKKRMKLRQEMAQQNSQMQAQANQQTAQVSAQLEAQKMQMEAQLSAQKTQIEAQAQAQLIEIEYGFKMELEKIKSQTRDANVERQYGFQQSNEDKREKAKDDRVKKQAVEQSKLISQRQGKRGELNDDDSSDILSQLFDNQ
jgi:hypothetical protein|tara:strand:+ start:4509 stop:6947 length:2439 start_codon:yes stop_codon:yes gene_type:complete